MSITVIGAAAVFDTIFPVERIPAPGETALVLESQELANPYPGGCAPNIAAGLARLGLPASLVYPVGDDFSGSSCEQDYLSLEIDLSHLCLQPGRPSGRAYLFFQPAGGTVCFSELGAAAQAQPGPGAPLGETVILAPVAGAFTHHYLRRALQEGRLLVVSGLVSEEVAGSLGQIALIVYNQMEVEQLCTLVGVDAIPSLALRYPNCRFFITYGEQGSRVYQGEMEKTIPALRPERAVDPTGAGDAYTAGVVAAWLKGYDLEVTGYTGAACASYVLEAFGAQTRQPSLPDVIRRLEQQAPAIARRL